jgi:O-antigen/teichoic acid export membrane protein
MSRNLVKKKTLKAVSFLWLGSLAGSGSTFLIYVILARKIGPEKFGILSNSLAIISVLAFLAGFGISKTWLKLFGEEGWRAIRWVKPSLKYVGVSLLLSLTIIFVISWISFEDVETRNLILILIFHLLGLTSVELVSSKLQLEERFGFLSVWQLSPNLIRLFALAASFFILKRTLNLYQIGFVYAVVGVLFLIVSIKPLSQMIKGRINLKGHDIKKYDLSEKIGLKQIFNEAWPFGLAQFFAFIYLQSDIIMVKYLSSNLETGYYNAAFTIMAGLLLIPSVLFGKYLLPKYHRWANKDRIKFYKAYKKGNQLMLISGLFILIVLVVSSKNLVPIVFGESFSKAVILVNILAFSIPVSFVSYSVGATLVTKNHMKYKVKLMGSVALLNVLLNLFLIPNYGAKGAAFATIISNILLFVLYLISVKKMVFNK